MGISEERALELAQLETPRSIERIVRFLSDLTMRTSATAVFELAQESGGAPDASPGSVGARAQQFSNQIAAGSIAEQSLRSLDWLYDMLRPYQIGQLELREFTLWLVKWDDIHSRMDVIREPLAADPQQQQQQVRQFVRAAVESEAVASMGHAPGTRQVVIVDEAEQAPIHIVRTHRPRRVPVGAMPEIAPEEPQRQDLIARAWRPPAAPQRQAAAVATAPTGQAASHASLASQPPAGAAGSPSVDPLIAGVGPRAAVPVLTRSVWYANAGMAGASTSVMVGRAVASHALSSQIAGAPAAAGFAHAAMPGLAAPQFGYALSNPAVPTASWMGVAPPQPALHEIHPLTPYQGGMPPLPGVPASQTPPRLEFAEMDAGMRPAQTELARRSPMSRPMGRGMPSSDSPSELADPEAERPGLLRPLEPQAHGRSPIPGIAAAMLAALVLTRGGAGAAPLMGMGLPMGTGYSPWAGLGLHAAGAPMSALGPLWLAGGSSLAQTATAGMATPALAANALARGAPVGGGMFFALPTGAAASSPWAVAGVPLASAPGAIWRSGASPLVQMPIDLFTGQPVREVTVVAPAAARPGQRTPVTPNMGELTVVAPPLQVASEHAERRGTAVAFDWASLAKSAGPLDSAGLTRLRSALPQGAQAVYPALPQGSLGKGAVNLRLAPSLLASLLGAGYGASATPLAAQAASLAGGATSMSQAPVVARIVPGKRPAGDQAGILADDGASPAGALAEAGGGQARRVAALDFLGMPVRLAPSLSGRSELHDEVALRGGETTAGSAPIRPNLFQALRQRLFPGMQSIHAEPDKGEWRKAAPRFGLRDADPTTVLSPDSRVQIPTATSTLPQIGTGAASSDRPLGLPVSLARPFVAQAASGMAAQGDLRTPATALGLSLPTSTMTPSPQWQPPAFQPETGHGMDDRSYQGQVGPGIRGDTHSGPFDSMHGDPHVDQFGDPQGDLRWAPRLQTYSGGASEPWSPTGTPFGSMPALTAGRSPYAIASTYAAPTQWRHRSAPFGMAAAAMPGPWLSGGSSPQSIGAAGPRIGSPSIFVQPPSPIFHVPGIGAGVANQPALFPAPMPVPVPFPLGSMGARGPLTMASMASRYAPPLIGLSTAGTDASRFAGPAMQALPSAGGSASTPSSAEAGFAPASRGYDGVGAAQPSDGLQVLMPTVGRPSAMAPSYGSPAMAPAMQDEADAGLPLVAMPAPDQSMGGIGRTGPGLTLPSLSAPTFGGGRPGSMASAPASQSIVSRAPDRLYAAPTAGPAWRLMIQRAATTTGAIGGPHTPAPQDNVGQRAPADTQRASVLSAKESGMQANEVYLLANDVWAILRRRLSAEADRRGRW